jgi:hypothetical protein
VTQEHTKAASETRAVDREAIRRELEETRQAFHALLDSLTDAESRRKSGNRAWTVRQLMWHIASNVGLTAGGVEMAKQGRNFNPPSRIGDRINVYMTKWGARRATKESTAEAYDEGHAKLLEALDAVEPDEWGKGSRVFGEYRTVEEHFHSVAEHFKEHRADIEKARNPSV